MPNQSFRISETSYLILCELARTKNHNTATKYLDNLIQEHYNNKNGRR